MEKHITFEEKIEKLRMDFRSATSGMVKPERGGNANGEYWIYANGMAGAKVLIRADQLARECHLPFPIAFANENILVSFSGEVIPKVRKLTKHGIKLSMEGNNSADIEMSVLGPWSAPD